MRALHAWDAHPVLAWGAAFSLAVHALLLALPTARPAPALMREGVGALRVHMVDVADVAPVSIVQDARTPASLSFSTSSTLAAPAPRARPRTLPSPALASAPAPEPAPALALPMIAEPDARERYLPKSQLTRAPAAQAPILIPPVPGMPPAGRHVGVLLILIDEEGRVQRVESDVPLLPPAMEEAARTAFMQARFTPGEREGRRVRSRLRVEVVFEDAAPPPHE